MTQQSTKTNLKQNLKLLIVAGGILLSVGIVYLIWFYLQPAQKVGRVFAPVMATLPPLEGDMLLSTDESDHLPPGTSYKHTPGKVTRMIRRVATADTMQAEQEFAELSRYFARNMGNITGETKDGHRVSFWRINADNVTYASSLFIIYGAGELQQNSLTISNPQLKTVLDQHFSQSSQPVYGYTVLASKIY